MTSDSTSGNIALVYFNNTAGFSDVLGSTHMAIITNAFQENGDNFYQVELLTDSEGQEILQPTPINVSASTIVSRREIRDITPHTIYQITNLPDKLEVGGLTTRSRPRALATTSRSGFGSGLYGIYTVNPTVYASPVAPHIHQLDFEQPYIVQDKEHGDSITKASLETNSYLDRLIANLVAARGLTTLSASAESLIEINDIQRLVNLWNIVLFRTGHTISKSDLESILITYLQDYVQDDSIRDEKSNEVLKIAPINKILGFLGFDGLLASDAYNNRWNRGCVLFSYRGTTPLLLTGSVEPY